MLCAETEFQTLSKLKFLGRITPGDKIHVPKLLIQPQSLYTSLYRTLFPCNRKETIHFIRGTLTQSTAIYRQAGAGRDTLSEDIRRALVGVANLRLTYDDDIKFVCDLDTIIEGTHQRLMESADNVHHA